MPRVVSRLLISSDLPFTFSSSPLPPTHSGLDNAGKTTIVKKLCGEDVSKTSPTLGFEIKTLAHNG